MDYYKTSDGQSASYTLGSGPPSLGNQMVETGGSSSTQVEWVPEGNNSMPGDRRSIPQLEQALFRINLQSQDGSEQMLSNFPERPEEPDCIYYIRTGQCAYGMACKFNHPRSSDQMNIGSMQGKLDYPERSGQPECQYYLKTGNCKFGLTCKYDHPRDKAGVSNQAPLNFAGLPIRIGEKECTFYMKTGLCKYGQTCRYNHPPLPPGSISSSITPNSPSPSVQSAPNPPWQIPRPPFVATPRLQIPASYPPMMMPSQQGLMTVPSWNYQSGIPQTQTSENSQQGMGNSYMQLDQSLSNPAVSPYQSQMYASAGMNNVHSPYQSSLLNKEALPQRMGQPECQYYMKTGDCKFGITCKFHHPKDRATPTPTSHLSVMGLPLRPGSQPCSFYVKYGICKFGQTCKFDHPLLSQDYSQASQLSLQQQGGGMQQQGGGMHPASYYNTQMQYQQGAMEVLSDNANREYENQTENYRTLSQPHSSASPDRQMYQGPTVNESSS